MDSYLHNRPLPVLDCTREAEHDPDRGIVAAIREHAHGHPVVGGGGAEPGLHVVTGSLDR